RNSVAMVHILKKSPIHGETATLCTDKNPAPTSRRLNCGFVGDVCCDQLHKGIERHHTEVFATSGAHGDGTRCLLLVACDEDVRQLLHRMLPYFIRNFLVAQVSLDPKFLIWQRFAQLL